MCSFSSGTGQIWLDDLACTSLDTRLVSCNHRAIGTHSCGHSEDIAVFCDSKLSAFLLHYAIILYILIA